MKVLPLPCKRVDLHVARMTSNNDGPVFGKRRKSIASIRTFVLHTCTFTLK